MTIAFRVITAQRFRSSVGKRLKTIQFKIPSSRLAEQVSTFIRQLTEPVEAKTSAVEAKKIFATLSRKLLRV